MKNDVFGCKIRHFIRIRGHEDAKFFNLVYLCSHKHLKTDKRNECCWNFSNCKGTIGY